MYSQSKFYYLCDMEAKVKNSGGLRKGAGPKQKYNEKTRMVSFRVPESKADDLRKLCNDMLDKWKIDSVKIKISKHDEHLLVNRKYIVRKLGKVKHVCRVVENAKGKFNVLLAQDILGMNCEILFIDGNTLNNEHENIRPVNREVEFIY